MWVESVLLEELDEVHYLLYYMKCSDVEKSREAVLKSTHASDAYHQDFKKAAWDYEGASSLECLIDFDRIDEGPAPKEEDDGKG